MQDAALVDDHERLAVEPSVMELGLTERLTVGAKATLVEADDDVPSNPTVTGIVTVPVVEVTEPVTVIAGRLCPGLAEALVVHESDVVPTVQVQPVPAMVAIANPVGGSVTVTVPLLAAVPEFVTVMV